MGSQGKKFFKKCPSCSGKGKIIYSAEGINQIKSNGIITIKQCSDCRGAGEILTEEGEAIFNLLVCKQD